MERAGDVLQRWLRRSGLAQGVRQHAALAVWPEVVGPALARVTEPVRVREGVLQVRVAGSAWRAELHHLAPRIVQRLNRRLAEPIRGIELIPGPVR